ncbi:hypothetical protein [Anabaena sp. CCY 0017]|uniref:hypothetical protein n=1 Tax=Anabaena sp. CCY 0017 TaxID=3103866 RepID=UPI0039C6151E
MNKSAILSTLKRIKKNENGKDLTHREVVALAYGLISVLEDITGISNETQEQLELFLRMMTKRGVPHHARCYQAAYCIWLLEADEELKKWQEITPEDELF